MLFLLDLSSYPGTVCYTVTNKLSDWAQMYALWPWILAWMLTHPNKCTEGRWQMLPNVLSVISLHHNMIIKLSQLLILLGSLCEIGQSRNCCGCCFCLHTRLYKYLIHICYSVIYCQLDSTEHDLHRMTQIDGGRWAN